MTETLFFALVAVNYLINPALILHLVIAVDLTLHIPLLTFLKTALEIQATEKLTI